MFALSSQSLDCTEMERKLAIKRGGYREGWREREREGEREEGEKASE